MYFMDKPTLVHEVHGFHSITILWTFMDNESEVMR